MRHVDFAGQVTEFVYDVINELVAKRFAASVADADAGNFQAVVSFTYDELSRVKTVNDTRYGIQTFDYDEQHRIVHIAGPSAHRVRQQAKQ